MAACLELGGWLEWNSDADCCWDMREEMIVSDFMYSSSVCSGKQSFWGAGRMREHQDKLPAASPGLG